MAIVSLPTRVEFPPISSGNVKFYNTGLTAGTANIITFDNNADALALVHAVPKSGTLTAVRFRTGNVSTTGATFRISIEQVSGAPATPSGTLAYTSAEGTVAVGTGDDNVWMTVSINGGTGVSVTAGDIVATVLSVDSGTPTTPNTVIITGGSTLTMALGNFPKLLTNTTGTWAASTSSTAVPFVWEYSDGLTYIYGMNAVSGGATSTIGNGNERALRFQVPAPVRVWGIGGYIQNVATGGDFRIRLYDSTPTLLTNGEIAPSADVDGDIFTSTTGDGYSEFVFPSPVTLSANTTYYASIYQRTANAVVIAEMTLQTSAYLAAMPGGSQCYLGTRSGGSGTFTDDQTRVPLIYLLIDGVDDGTGSGGGESSSVFG